MTIREERRAIVAVISRCDQLGWRRDALITLHDSLTPVSRDPNEQRLRAVQAYAVSSILWRRITSFDGAMALYGIGGQDERVAA